jgi:hypothetical protein
LGNTELEDDTASAADTFHEPERMTIDYVRVYSRTPTTVAGDR